MAIKGQAINVTLTAIDASTGKRKTGDSTNISVYLVKDGVAAARNDATAISETDATNCPGEYTVELDATDMNANTVVVTGKSSTANIEIVPVKIVTEVGKIADISGRIPDALVGGNIKADVIAISGDTTAADNAELMFDGTGYAGGTTKLQTAVASIATDAVTADALKTDAVTKIQSGLSTHSAADVKTAIEAAGSSIASILADTAALQTDWVDGGRLDLLIDAIKAKTDTYVVPPTTSEIKTALEIAGGTLSLILADTGELQTDWVNGGRLDLLIDAIKAKTDNLPATPAAVGSAMTLTSAYDAAKTAASQTSVNDIPTTAEFEARTLPSASYALDSTVAKDSTVMKAANYTVPDNVNIVVASQRAVSADNKATSIESKLDLVKAKTDTIPANPAQVGSAMTLTSAYDAAKTAASQASVDGIDTIVNNLHDTDIPAIKTETASIQSDTNDIQTRLPAALVDGKMDSSATVALSAEDIGDISDAVIAGLGGATVTITSPVSQSNDVTILRDTDYTTEIAWTYTYSGSLTGYTAALHCAGAGITSHTVAIGGIAGAYTLTAAFTNAETAALDTCIDDYSITFTKTADNTVLPYGVEGVMIVRDWAGT